MNSDVEYKNADDIRRGESVRGKHGDAVIKVAAIELTGDNLKFSNRDGNYLIVDKGYQFSRKQNSGEAWR